MTTSYTFIDTSEELRQFCDSATRFPWLAVDTEFIRERTYYPQWCLLQLATPEDIACIDVLAIDDLSCAFDLMSHPRVTKIFHAASQDMEIFHLTCGKTPAPVFDTQLAAALAGHGDQVGYAKLVHNLLGVELEKGHTRCDWSHRPLSGAELAYAAEDVCHLGAMYQILYDELDARGRLQWLQSDFEALGNGDRYSPDPDSAWKRLKGIGRLRPRQQHVAALLASWREKEAIEQNKPRKWILKDNALLDLARRPPRSLNEMGRFRDLGADVINRYGDALLALLARAGDLPSEPLAESKRRLESGQEPVIDLLMACLRDIAVRNDLSVPALAKRTDLEKLVAGEHDIPLLKGWRKAAAGKQLLEVLEGELSVNVEKGRLHHVRREM